MKKKEITLYGLLAILSILVIYFGIKSNSLQKEIGESSKVKEELDVLVTGNKELIAIDSVLIEGDYNKAIASYNSTLENHEELNSVIPLRIALAEKLRQNEIQSISITDNKSISKDSTNIAPSIQNELRSIDSLNFALEKARVQLTNMRKQLNNKSFGEYLSFTTKKGTALHYVGQVKNNMANGLGIAVLETGSRYEGEWKDNERNGQGTFYWSDGEYYIGSYKNDMRSGEGTYFWPNGEKYKGQWKNDKRNGKGIFHKKEGSVISGVWEDDKLIETDKLNKK
ncbi:MORN repeat-containing protein [Maribacter sp. LLG6340-A2]|uniref:MORN repeat-containing protein n=1 Tax=Maribacter sp. LLG6340-A2 TaxID=3160834 RepID=UPI00386DD5F1